MSTLAVEDNSLSRSYDQLVRCHFVSFPPSKELPNLLIWETLESVLETW